jgi:hypothetical protein
MKASADDHAARLAASVGDAQAACHRSADSALQALRARLAAEAEAAVDAVRREAAAAHRVALQEQRRQARQTLAARTQRLRRLLANAAAAVAPLSPALSSAAGQGAAATTAAEAAAAAAVGQGASDLLARLQGACEEYRLECEGAIDERGQLAEELVRLRLEARSLRAEVQTLRLRRAFSGGGQEDDGASRGGGDGGSGSDAVAGSVDWWRAKCQQLARANDMLAQRLDAALGAAADDTAAAEAAAGSSAET